MPQRIDVPGMGVVEFPDGMDDAQITAAIQQNMGPPQQQPQRGAMDKLTGGTGERYQTWPERLVRGIGVAVKSGVTLPGDVMKEAQQPAPAQISDSDVSTLSVPRAMDFSGIATPINPAVRSGDQAVPGMARNMVPAKVKVPTTEELAGTGGQQINAAKNSGLDIKSSAASSWAEKFKRDLMADGIHPVDAEKTYAKLAEIENAPSGSFVTAANLQSLRESLGVTAQNFNPQFAKDQLAASRAIRELDGLLPTIDPSDVLAGSPAATQKLFEQGRGNYAAAMRSNDLTGKLDRANTGLIERAETRAQASHSGRNIDNTLRQKLASLLEKPKEVSGFSDAEIAALNQSIQGSKTRNIARAVGNNLGGGGGIGQTGISAIGAGFGAAAGTVGGQPIAGAMIGAGVPATVGASARALANALAKKSVRGVDEMVRMRSPLYQDAARSAGMVGAPTTQQDALVRALLEMRLQPQQQ